MSFEKYDMSIQRTDIPRPDDRAAAQVRMCVVEPAELPARCVWTDHLGHSGCRCDARIPTRTVVSAWQRELTLGRTRADFFHFAWRGRVWLAYGLPDGTVRGVYCPTHRAEREERLGYDPELVLPARPASPASRGITAAAG